MLARGDGIGISSDDIVPYVACDTDIDSGEEIERLMVELKSWLVHKTMDYCTESNTNIQCKKPNIAYHGFELLNKTPYVMLKCISM